MVNPNIQFVLHDKIEELRGILLELLSRVDVIEERWPQDLDVLR